ncbi:MAG TPA: DUF885 domain-containing protein [Dehalococcoidia bacterium]|nr:DUF885 domain-containing protein [Dehalococcoidia bacterium]
MDDSLSRIADDYIESTNRRDPGGATARGFHQYDSELADRSREALEARQAEVRGLLRRLEALGPLEGGEAHEAAFLKRRLQWELTEHEEVRGWQRSPTSYLSATGSSCNNLVIREFAPLPARLESLVSRLRQAPRLLAQARANLLDPPTYAVDNAIEAAAGLRVLLQRDLPAAAAPAPEALRAEVERACQDALAAVDAYAGWLKTELAARAVSDFAWGPETFRKLLSFGDCVDDPIDTLIRRGEEDLKRHQERLREVAATIQSGAPPEEVVDRVSQDHPSADELLPETEALLEDLRRFAIEAGLCTMPTEVRIRLAETPGFSRMTTQAACSSPGPFEEVAKEAYYYVTPPDPDWPPERTEAYLKFFNRWSIPGVTAHEAYPGHYVHLVYLQRAPTRLGRFLRGTTTLIEGWAHYIEQVLVEAGYGGGDPRYELMQLREALLRLCRYRCAFGLHVEGWTLEQGIDFFVREGYATPIIAERETKRGILGPNYYAYTLGKHQILALRQKLREREGPSFNLRQFHDAFMQFPFPVATIEKLMLGDGAA